MNLTKNLDTAILYSMKAKEAIRLFGISMPAPTVVFKIHDIDRKLLGAFMSKGLNDYSIFLNPRALMVAPGYAERLIAHELAHWVCRATGVDNGGDHGPGWKRVCESLGGTTESISNDISFKHIWKPQLFNLWEGEFVDEYLTCEEHQTALILKSRGEMRSLKSYTGRKILL